MEKSTIPKRTWQYGKDFAIEECIKLLSETPLMFRERKEFSPPVRIQYYGSHLIIYIKQDSYILIVRVLHDRMNLKKHLKHL